AAALTAPIAAVAERARLVDALRAKKVSGGSRRVTLSGRTLVPGRALGAVFAFPRPSPRSSGAAVRPPRAEVDQALDRAFAAANKALEGFGKRAHGAAGHPDLAFLDEVRTILEDARIRERTVELTASGEAVAPALTRVGAEAMRTATRVGDEFGIRRAHRIAETCEALAVLSSGVPQWEVPRHAVWIGEQITVFDLLVSMRAAAPAAVILSGPAASPEARAVLELFGVPSVGEVAGLFQWAGDGAIALVDGDHGLVRVNPSRIEIAALRAEKNQG
ncbi:MAG TPA: phosphoenolpyruvate-utilizing N-terminal domain-containing protein, partial [Myxococcaceae bacterium]|nr:phosphoenolpyruvate-utilizing N-terminal domain-containing protein [Myxococcaceae bacterium]